MLDREVAGCQGGLRTTIAFPAAGVFGGSACGQGIGMVTVR
jgi:hypothetical protein